MAFSRSPRTRSIDISQCDASTPPEIATAIRRLTLSLQHSRLSPRDRQSTMIKIQDLQKKVAAAKLDCQKRVKHQRAIQSAQSKAERRAHEAQSKMAKYESQRMKAETRHAKKVQSVELARMRKEAGEKSPAEKAVWGIGIAGILGTAAYFIIDG